MIETFIAAGLLGAYVFLKRDESYPRSVLRVILLVLGVALYAHGAGPR